MSMYTFDGNRFQIKVLLFLVEVEALDAMSMYF